ncbi:hypothetical protein PENSPDRAFT_557892, partial [Peniophora sp. CONT]
EDEGGAGGKKKSKARRRKVNHACLYCRRSHMTCDEGRPCQRCIKREIGHLCHDERRPANAKQPSQDPQPQPAPAITITRTPISVFSLSTAPLDNPYNPYMYPLESFGKEFSSLSDFLETLDEHAFFSSTAPGSSGFTPTSAFTSSLDFAGPSSIGNVTGGAPPEEPLEKQEPVLPAASMTEKFLLTAADQEPGPRDERLKRVIRTKYEAGLLRPYNYVKGYARLSRWMDRNVSQASKQQILHPLSVLRPKFRAIAQSLRDIDLVFIEEAFERLLLDYDRVFSVMGIPACLWRRTGEIYKGNREFAELVGVEGWMLRDGRLCIYELMAEESAVNYWEKYGNVAFDSSQKAVLTSCVLRFKPKLTTSGTAVSEEIAAGEGEEALIACCFSFTIRRDTWGIPSMIVGNFIR